MTDTRCGQPDGRCRRAVPRAPREPASIGAHRQLLEDGLYGTDSDRLTRRVEAEAANAVLVKPNQAGTVSWAARVVRHARAAGYVPVVSARSGDTEDSWLGDLAVGWSAGRVGVGSMTRSERTAKWNRLLEIEAELGTSVRFAGYPARFGWPRQTADDAWLAGGIR